MSLDLEYKNKDGISLKHIVDVIKQYNTPITKKDITDKLQTTKSIDTLLNKLTESGLLIKVKDGKKLLFSLINESKDDEEIQSTKKRKVTKAKPKADRTPADVKKINIELATVNKTHNVNKLIEMEEEQKLHIPTNEIDIDALNILKKELESKIGKDVTAILHRRGEAPEKKKKKDVVKIFEEHKDELDLLEVDNPYRFVLNFFTSILNKEFGTPYFRRRDAYVVKSIYNKFKSMCDKVEDYNPDMQHMPFYRVITINEEDLTVKIYHIDVNRVVRGVHVIFKLHENDKDYLFLPLKNKKIN